MRQRRQGSHADVGVKRTVQAKWKVRHARGPQPPVRANGRGLWDVLFLQTFEELGVWLNGLPMLVRLILLGIVVLGVALFKRFVW